MIKEFINIELFKNGPIIIFVWENKDCWPVTDVSKNINNIFGYEVEDFISNKINYLNLIHQDDLQKVCEEVIQNSSLEDNDTFVHAPYRIKSKAGKYHWVRDITTIVRKKGEITHYIGYIQDITLEINIRKENEQAKLALQSINDGIWDWDLNTNECYFSKNLKKMIGFKEDEFDNNIKSWQSRIHPEDKEQTFKNLNDHLYGRTKSFVSEYRILCKNGTYKWILCRGDVVEYTIDKKPKRLIGTNTDISDKKKYELELIESEAKFVQMFKTHSSVMLLIDPNSSKIIDANISAANFYGYSIEELTSMNFDNITTTKKNILKENHQKALEGVSNYFQGKHKLKNGSIIDIELYISPVTTLGGTYLFSIVHDITLREKQKQILKNQKEEFETIFNNAKDGIAIIDIYGKFLEFNEEFLNITGYERKELLNKTTLDLSIPTEKQYEKSVIFDVIAEGFKKNYQRSYIHKSGEMIVLNMSSSLMPDKNRILITTKDITKDKFFEQQNKLASMGEMIGNIAHQWRQPLSIIHAVSSNIKLFEQLGKKIEQNELIHNMETINEQVQYLSKTIDDFRNFIKDNNKKELISINEIISKTLKLLKPTLNDYKIKVITTFEFDITIEAYTNELIQSFINIINNSKDAINHKKDKDSKKLLFITTQKTNDGLLLEIKDNGEGIKEELLDKIFEPYFTTKHQSIGTGIGLSMTYKILTQHHNCKIETLNTVYEYEKKEEKGLSFRILFNPKA